MEKLNLRKKGIIIIVISVILILAIGTICFAMIKMNNNAIETISKNDKELEENHIEENIIDVDMVKENEDKKEIKKKNNSISSDKYYVKINVYANVVNVFTKDTNGNYTVPVKGMLCSTGKATPNTGQYRLNGTKHRWHTLFGNLYGQYTTAIFGDILFHSVPYSRNGDPSSLMYGYYDKLGTRASAGCIRLTVQDAIWIYNNIPTGTLVEFYSSSDPGPFGKPTVQKISSNTVCRGWDPTDPLPANPWKNYVEPIKTQGENTQITQPSQPPVGQPTQPSTPDNVNNPEKPKDDNTISGGDPSTNNTTLEGENNETVKIIN